MYKFIVGIALLLIPASLHALPPSEKAQEQLPAQVTVRGRGPGCSVDLDDQRVGKTDDHGVLVLQEVEPGDHYLHLRCPNEEEKGLFISPRSGQNVLLDESKAEGTPEPQADAALTLAETQIRLRQLVQQAVQLRARGRLEQAVENLRAAAELDPVNSDLHRELGITFLLDKDWKRARIEMLEAIRHDPTDADAYNGLGYALEKMGDLDEAVKQYRMATQLDPKDATYRTHYFDALSRLAQERAKKK
jgi:tetratricopeptide (TPR) repeat protein